MKNQEQTPQSEAALIADLQKQLADCLENEKRVSDFGTKESTLTDDEKWDLVRKDIHYEKVLINSCRESALCRSAEDHARALARLIFLASLADSVQDDPDKEDVEALAVGNMFVHLLLDHGHTHRRVWDELAEDYSLVRSKLEYDTAKSSYEYWLADSNRRNT